MYTKLPSDVIFHSSPMEMFALFINFLSSNCHNCDESKKRTQMMCLILIYFILQQLT